MIFFQQEQNMYKHKILSRIVNKTITLYNTAEAYENWVSKIN